MAYNTIPYSGKVCKIEENGIVIEFTNGWHIDICPPDKVNQGSWTGSFSGNREEKAISDKFVANEPGKTLTDFKFLLDGSTNVITGDIRILGLKLTRSDVTYKFKGQGKPK